MRGTMVPSMVAWFHDICSLTFVYTDIFIYTYFTHKTHI